MIATAFFCSRRIRQRNGRKNHEPVAYQPKKRTAVRSPSGIHQQAPHYLKKSPSPTTITKPLPGTLSPTTEIPQNTAVTIPSSQVKTQSISMPPSSKYSEENEIQAKIIERNGQMDTSIGSDIGDTQECGKLGSLVFKLRYLLDRNALVVSVIRCRALPYKAVNDELSNGINGKSQSATDPYVKLQLLPEKQHKVKTR